MATQTTHYNLIKPSSADRVAVGDLNDNADTIDGYLYIANERADQISQDYNPSSTYNTGDYVRRENYIYKCKQDNVTGTWDATKWDRVYITDELGQGSGGSSTLAGLNDVSLSSPTNGQLLGYNSVTQKWENVNGGGGGSSTLAGLSDVSVSGVANKDIIRYNSTSQKYEKSSDLTDLELSVSQLSSSVLSIAGDVDTLELTVSQMSASTLPYDANTSTKQKIDNVESSIPTSASDLPYSSTQSTKQKIDEVASADTTELSFTPVSTVIVSSSYIKRDGRVIMCLLRLNIANISNNTETKIGEIPDFNSEGYLSGAVVSAFNTRTIGGFVLSGRNLYCRLLSDATENEKSNVSISMYSIK